MAIFASLLCNYDNGVLLSNFSLQSCQKHTIKGHDELCEWWTGWFVVHMSLGQNTSFSYGLGSKHLYVEMNSYIRYEGTAYALV